MPFFSFWSFAPQLKIKRKKKAGVQMCWCLIVQPFDIVPLNILRSSRKACNFSRQQSAQIFYLSAAIFEVSLRQIVLVNS